MNKKIITLLLLMIFSTGLCEDLLPLAYRGSGRHFKLASDEAGVLSLLEKGSVTYSLIKSATPDESFTVKKDDTLLLDIPDRVIGYFGGSPHLVDVIEEGGEIHYLFTHHGSYLYLYASLITEIDDPLPAEGDRWLPSSTWTRSNGYEVISLFYFLPPGNIDESPSPHSIKQVELEKGKVKLTFHKSIEDQVYELKEGRLMRNQQPFPGHHRVYLRELLSEKHVFDHALSLDDEAFAERIDASFDDEGNLNDEIKEALDNAVDKVRAEQFRARIEAAWNARKANQ